MTTLKSLCSTRAAQSAALRHIWRARVPVCVAIPIVVLRWGSPVPTATTPPCAQTAPRVLRANSTTAGRAPERALHSWLRRATSKSAALRQPPRRRPMPWRASNARRWCPGRCMAVGTRPRTHNSSSFLLTLRRSRTRSRTKSWRNRLLTRLLQPPSHTHSPTHVHWPCRTARFRNARACLRVRRSLTRSGRRPWGSDPPDPAAGPCVWRTRGQGS